MIFFTLINSGPSRIRIVFLIPQVVCNLLHFHWRLKVTLTVDHNSQSHNAEGAPPALLSDTVKIIAKEKMRKGDVTAVCFICVKVFWLAVENNTSVFVFVKFCAKKIYPNVCGNE